jgi:hypothetical protein
MTTFYALRRVIRQVALDLAAICAGASAMASTPDLPPPPRYTFTQPATNPLDAAKRVENERLQADIRQYFSGSSKGLAVQNASADTHSIRVTEHILPENNIDWTAYVAPIAAPTTAVDPWTAKPDDVNKKEGIAILPIPNEQGYLIRVGPKEMQSKIAGMLPEPADVSQIGPIEFEIKTKAPVTISIPTLDPTATGSSDTQDKGEHGSPLEPLVALTAVSEILDIYDFVEKRLKRRKESAGHKNSSQPQPTHVLQGDRAILAAESKAETTVITAEDIKRAAENDRKLIVALRDSIQIRYDLWTALYPQQDASTVPQVNDLVKAKVNELELAFCQDLKKLQRFFESAGKQLAGYGAIASLCQSA